MGRKPIAFPLCIECGVNRVAVWSHTKAPICDTCIRERPKGGIVFDDGETFREFRRRLNEQRNSTGKDHTP